MRGFPAACLTECMDRVSRVLAACRRRLPALQPDDGPAGELGLDLPEENPMLPRSVVADDAANVDTDVVAQQRWVISQS